MNVNVSQSENPRQISPSMRLGDIMKIYPSAQRALFRQYHVGGCSSCGFSMDETLEQLCSRNEQMQDMSAVLKFLEQSQNQDAALQITPTELQSRISSSKKAQQSQTKLLDIRTREEFEAVHIPDSILFSQDMMQEILMNWPNKKDASLVVLIDHQGTRNLDAAAYFLGQGFENVKALKGGIDAWSQEIDPSLPRYRLE